MTDIGRNLCPVITVRQKNMPPCEDDVILLLGRVVYEAQETEATVHLAMTMIFGLTIADSIENLKKIYAKKTSGQFLNMIRAKIGLSENFDDYMQEYIDRRNFIVHNLSRSSIFSLYSDDGREKLHNFLSDFRYRNRKIKLTFVALCEIWMQLVTPEYTAGDNLKQFKNTSLFEEITNEFIPQLSSIFVGQDKNANSTNRA